ncbi:hypothetical protein U9M48_038515 [Paspalum notatum var. saurae]|uniref:SWIM-type domain-containing protein n=1 Tax=Paspalum notatum var. saurae TaxID=547442 RepID=A0AAQ3XAE6_PASNO
MDGTHLTGRSRGVLACAVAVDGLVISADASKGIEAAVEEVYPGVEHRECMRHLWKNMKKNGFSGELYGKNMWCAAKSYTVSKYDYFMGKIEEKDPSALEWLHDNHPYVWSRSKFFEDCKRTKIGSRMSRVIIPSIIKYLNGRTKSIKDHEVLICGAGTAEVTVNKFRNAVNLELKTCSCRVWQLTGKPCSHALAYIAKLSREVQMDEFVHDYFSVERFRKAYAGTFSPMTSKDEWSKPDLGYTIHKPKLRRKPGRPRKSRIKPYDECKCKGRGKGKGKTKRKRKENLSANATGRRSGRGTRGGRRPVHSSNDPMREEFVHNTEVREKEPKL